MTSDLEGNLVPITMDRADLMFNIRKVSISIDLFLVLPPCELWFMVLCIVIVGQLLKLMLSLHLLV